MCSIHTENRNCLLLSSMFVIFYDFSLCSVEIAEYCDEEGVRFSMEDSRRRFPGGIVGSLHFGWKSRSNHFVSYNDLVTKGMEQILCNFSQIHTAGFSAWGICDLMLQ